MRPEAHLEDIEQEVQDWSQHGATWMGDLVARGHITEERAKKAITEVRNKLKDALVDQQQAHDSETARREGQRTQESPVEEEAEEAEVAE